MNKKVKVVIAETTNKNIKVGDKFGVNILANNSGIRGKCKARTSGKKKPKQPTLREIVLVLVDRFGKLEKEVMALRENDEKIFDILDRNNLK
jgi:hypothetical protein